MIRGIAIRWDLCGIFSLGSQPCHDLPRTPVADLRSIQVSPSHSLYIKYTSQGSPPLAHNFLMTTPYSHMHSDDYGDEPPNVLHPDRPHSIDLTLELEQQLDDESTPNSPAFPRSRSRPQSLDPHVLASIVTQLRLSLSEVTKERDELSAILSETQSNELSMKDALHTLAEKCVRLETDLTASQDKNREDADAISMLRGKLEDSRYVRCSSPLCSSNGHTHLFQGGP